MMNKLILTSLFCTITFFTNAQQIALTPQNSEFNNSIDLNYSSISSDEFSQPYSISHYNMMMQLKKDRHPLEKTGRALTFVGIPMAVLGAIMVSGSESTQYQCYNGDCQGDASGAFGALFLIGGVGMTITGAVLWTMGAKK